MRRPPPPVYKGPTEMNLKIAEARVKTRQWHLEKRDARFKTKHQGPAVTRTST